MDVTAVQPVRLQEIVAIPDSTRRERFAVAANQTFDGQVISVEGDTVLVSIGQQRVPAQAQPGTTLRAGEAIRLFVRDVDPDQVVMQIVARGGSMQTMRSLTTEDLRSELTGLGVTPDDQAVDIARALINRGLAVTAQNVLEVRTAMTRLGAGAGAADLDAAVFLKGQGLPMTADGVQIVRQALQSRSALGAQVEGLRTALADLAFRLTAQGVVPAPRGPVVTISTAAETADAAPAPVPNATSTAASVEADAPALADAPDAPAGVANRAPTAQGGAAPVAEEAPAPSAGGRPSAAAPAAEAAPQPSSSVRVVAAAADDGVAAPPPSGVADGAEAVAALNAAAVAEDSGAPAPAPPGARSHPPALLAPDEGAAAPSRSPGAATASPAAVPVSEPTETQAATATRAGAASEALAPSDATQASDVPAGTTVVVTDGAAQARPEPSLPRLLAVVAEALDRLPLLDDHAVEQGPEALTNEIRRVIADHGTPVEAKLARVLEGLAGRADLERLLATDLKSSLQALVQEIQAQLALAERLPPETARELRSANRQAEALLGQVELQQLANAAPRTEGQQPTYLMFQLPIPGGREPQTAQIRIRQESDGGTAKIDAKNVHVVFQLELQNLRTVRVGIRVVDKHLSCQMGSSDPAATELLAEHAPELREGLAGLGYVVEPIKTAVLTAADLVPPEREVTPVARPAMRVDARA